MTKLENMIVTIVASGEYTSEYNIIRAAADAYHFHLTDCETYPDISSSDAYYHFTVKIFDGLINKGIICADKNRTIFAHVAEYPTLRNPHV